MNTRFGSVCVISLGCAKNLVDSEHMLGILQAKGFTLTSDMDKADFAVINTCGFLESAVEEAIDVVLETARLKKQGPLRRLVGMLSRGSSRHPFTPRISRSQKGVPTDAPIASSLN